MHKECKKGKTSILPFLHSLCIISKILLRITGVEPARLLTLEPKSSASANSAISAYPITDFCSVISITIISSEKQKSKNFYFCFSYCGNESLVYVESHTLAKMIQKTAGRSTRRQKNKGTISDKSRC